MESRRRPLPPPRPHGRRYGKEGGLEIIRGEGRGQVGGARTPPPRRGSAALSRIITQHVERKYMQPGGSIDVQSISRLLDGLYWHSSIFEQNKVSRLKYLQKVVCSKCNTSEDSSVFHQKYLNDGGVFCLEYLRT